MFFLSNRTCRTGLSRFGKLTFPKSAETKSLLTPLITKISCQCSMYIKYYSYFCSKTTKVDKIFGI